MTGEQKPGGLEVARKAELYDHMKAVAEANGFKSLTEAIARATAAEAKLARAVEGLEWIDKNKSIAPVWVQRKVRDLLAALQQEGE